MNIQAILCSFVLAGGAVMICVTTRTVDDDGDLKGKTKHIVEYIGIGLVVIGGLGYLFTIYEVLRRGHTKISKGHMRKLEKQVHQRRITGGKMTELRSETLAIPVEMIDGEEKF